MTTIKLAEFYSPFCNTMAGGKMVLDKIIGPLNEGETVTLDFEGVKIVAPPFTNAAIGPLYELFDEMFIIQNVRAINENELTKRILRATHTNSFVYYNNIQARVALDAMMARRADDFDYDRTVGDEEPPHFTMRDNIDFLLSKLYDFDKDSPAMGFLETNLFLVPLLIEAYTVLRELFPTEKFGFGLLEAWEGDEYHYIWVSIEYAKSAEEWFETIKIFEDTWLYPKYTKMYGKLHFSPYFL